MDDKEFRFDPTHLIWTEKYRPQRIRECILPEEIKKTLQSFVDTKNMPHLMLSGSAGIGKTTVAKALCAEFGYDWILINGSNARDIDTVRGYVSNFASSLSLNDSKFKVVIFDEADHLLPLTQAALRGIMEEFAKTVRFVFTCNYPNKIIDALHSRCTNISLTIKKDEMPAVAASFFKRTQQILEEQEIKFEKKAVVQVIQKFFPDFRRTLNEMQRVANAANEISMEVITQIGEEANILPFIKAIKEKDFGSARKWISSNSHNDPQITYRKFYDSCKDFVADGSIPSLILLIGTYAYRAASSIDPEINMAAFAIECMSEIEFK